MLVRHKARPNWDRGLGDFRQRLDKRTFTVDVIKFAMPADSARPAQVASPHISAMRDKLTAFAIVVKAEEVVRWEPNDGYPRPQFQLTGRCLDMEPLSRNQSLRALTSGEWR